MNKATNKKIRLTSMPRNWLRVHRSSLSVLGLLIAILLFYVFMTTTMRRTPHTAPLLVVATDFSAENNGPLSVYNLDDGSVTNLSFGGEACDGVAYDASAVALRIACRIGQESRATYDVRSRMVSTTTAPFPHQPTFRSPLACAPNGKCYYGFGYSGAVGDERGRILVTEGGILKRTIPVPNRTDEKFPVRLVVSGNTLWVLERGWAKTSAVVLRFDMVREEFVGEPISIGGDALDMAVNERVIAVSIYFPEDGTKRVMLFDAMTGAPHFGLEGGTTTTPYVLGVAIHNNVLYTAGVGGVVAYSLETFAPIARYTTKPLASSITYGNGSIFVSVPPLQFLELDPKTLALRHATQKKIGFGNLTVIERQ